MYLQGIGTAVPDHVMTQEEAARRLCITSANTRTHRVIRRVGRQSGIAKRHLAALGWQDGSDGAPLYRCVGDQPQGPGMGARNRLFDVAAADLIRRACESLPGAIAAARTLVTASCTHASSPGLERPIFEHTGINAGIQRWNLGFMGCSAGLAGLRLVFGLEAQRQPALVCTCELSSLHFQYSDAPDQITANMLFSDGAAAVLLGQQRSTVAVLNCHCEHVPAAADQMLWFADDHGLRLELSRDLPQTLARHLSPAVDGLLGAVDRRRATVDHWLVHPGGPQILEAVEQALELDGGALEDSRAVLSDYGNMSSSTIFFVLQRLLQRRPQGLAVALAFGPGLTIELAALEISRP